MFYKTKVFLLAILMLLAMVFVGCDFVMPGANGELSATVTIIDAPENMWSQDINWWQTKGPESKGCGMFENYLLVQAAPPEGGTVTGSGCHGICLDVNISATANAGYVFDFWTPKDGSIDDVNSPTTVYSMPCFSKPATVTAHFKKTDDNGGCDCCCCDCPDCGDCDCGDCDCGDIDCGDVDCGDCNCGDVDVDVEVPVDCGDVNVEVNTPIWNSEYDRYIYIYFNIENTGKVDIQEFTVYFTAYGVSPGGGTPIKSTDYTAYTGSASGVDLAVGENRNSFAQIDVANDKVVFVELANLDLK